MTPAHCTQNKPTPSSSLYRRAVRRKANFLTRTKKSQLRPKKAIVWAHFWPFSGYIGFSSYRATIYALAVCIYMYTYKQQRDRAVGHLSIILRTLRTNTAGVTYITRHDTLYLFLTVYINNKYNNVKVTLIELELGGGQSREQPR